MLEAIKNRLDKCETWKQPHSDITWLVARIAELEAQVAEHEDAAASIHEPFTIEPTRTREIEMAIRFTKDSA